MATLSFDVPDEVLERTGLTEREARIELACRLFDAQRISKGEATRLCGLSRTEFEQELARRDLPVIRYTQEMWEQDERHLRMRDSKPQGGESH